MKHFLIFYIGVNYDHEVIRGNTTQIAPIFPKKAELEFMINLTNDFKESTITNIITLTEEEYYAWIEEN